MNSLYENKLTDLLNNPSSFSGTPGYQFALNQGLEAVNRSNSAMRGSGNALADLTKYATGLASQNYGDYRDFLGKMVGQEQGYDVNTTRNANDLTLGLGRNANDATANANALTLGNARNANDATRIKNDYELGLGKLGTDWGRIGSDYALGHESNMLRGQNDYWNYDLGRERNANDAARGYNDFTLGSGQNYNNWLNSVANLKRSYTGRG